MGLGKTVMALALVGATLDQQSAPTLVVCTPSLVEQWRQEVERWLPEADCVVVEGKKKGSLAAQLKGRKGVAVASYTALRNIDVTGAQLHRIIMDEAHTMGSLRPPSESTMGRVGHAEVSCLGAAWVLLGCCLGAAWVLLGCCLGAAWVLLGWGVRACVVHPPTHLGNSSAPRRCAPPSPRRAAGP